MASNNFLRLGLLGGLLVCLPAEMLAQASAKDGQAIYARSCVACHATDGAPKEPVAKLLKVEMRHLGATEVQAKTDDVLKKEILQGTGKMKAIKLTDAEAANVIAFLRSLKK